MKKISGELGRIGFPLWSFHGAATRNATASMSSAVISRRGVSIADINVKNIQ